jgi:hypothetical protein
MTPWLIALVLARSLDATSSAIALQNQNLTEGVPWMPQTAKGHIALQAGVAAGQVWYLNKLSAKHPKIARGLAVAQIGISGSVVTMNIQIMRRVR